MQTSSPRRFESSCLKGELYSHEVTSLPLVHSKLLYLALTFVNFLMYLSKVSWSLFELMQTTR